MNKKREPKIKAKKSLGQNFLRDERIIAKIFSAIAPKKGELLVEVGPGEGVVTHLLAEAGADVIAVELDDRLISPLRERFADFPNVRVIHDDVRRVYWGKEIDGRPYRVVGNLPYYVASSIARLFLEQTTQPVEAYYMMQREVVDRICAKPGDMSILSVAIQYYAEPEMLFVVPATAFDPIPKVESAFFRIRSRRIYDRTRDRAFFRVVRAGFSARRKTLANNLSSSFRIPRENIESWCAEIGLATSARAQELSVEQWLAMEEKISANFTTDK